MEELQEEMGREEMVTLKMEIGKKKPREKDK